MSIIFGRYNSPLPFGYKIKFKLEKNNNRDECLPNNKEPDGKLDKELSIVLYKYFTTTTKKIRSND